jgi:hypothetical protein
MFDRT